MPKKPKKATPSGKNLSYVQHQQHQQQPQPPQQQQTPAMMPMMMAPPPPIPAPPMDDGEGSLFEIVKSGKNALPVSDKS